MNSVKSLQHHGQSIWLDFLARGFVADGDLKRMIAEDGLRGLTSNPSIFEKAIGGSDEYDGAIKEALKGGDASPSDLFDAVSIADIQAAADVLRPVYDELKGRDGFVSLEVSPYLALDTDKTIAEAVRLHERVKRPNLMVKVPATPGGLPAIQALIAKGISINVTLLFSQATYRDVAEAYIAGLEAWVAAGGDPAPVASVASFFVSRIDSVVDKALDGLVEKHPARKSELDALKGKVAIANAKLAYQDYKRLFSGPRWEKLAAKGAQPQRLLWASTGTKNKAYRDTLYIEELIGPKTVNTVPPATLDSFRDHGKLRNSLEDNIDDARRVIDALATSGISLDDVTRDLVTDGVQQFADAADKLYGAVAHKRVTVLGDAVDAQTLSLGALQKAYEDGLAEWRKKGLIRRLWAEDATVWTGTDEAKWLGWLDSVGAEAQKADAYREFAAWVKSRHFTHAVVLGMGGSSLGPEVLARTFAQAVGFPALHILDSTDPAQVRAMADRVDLAQTLFIVSSKSGGTTEPNVMKDYFFARVQDSAGDKAGQQFVAVTDPGSSLERVAKQQGFAHIFYGNPKIGGRYSVLSPFGMVPAAAAGFDVARLLKHAATMVLSCGADVPPSENPGVQLGIALGVAGLAGRDKVTITASRSLSDFGAWAEQLIAESTGKQGHGLIPVEGETLGSPDVYGDDRIFVDLHVKGDDVGTTASKLAALANAGHPVIRIAVTSPDHLAQEFFRFEIATAVAGAVLGINPFDQPDVEAAKIRTRELIAAYDKSGALPGETSVASFAGLSLFTDSRNENSLRKDGAGDDLTSWIRALVGNSEPGDYIALLAYIEHDEANISALQDIRSTLRDATHRATCAQFGPRFLHSTGQAYKGGPNNGIFLQITADPEQDLAVPGQTASFATIIAAQARGDFDVLTDRKRRALRIHIAGDLKDGLARLTDAVRTIKG